MDDRQVLIEHLIQHYIDRDLFRHAVSEYMHRTRHRVDMATSISFLRNAYTANEIMYGNTKVDGSTVHITRESLKRCKPTTLNYLHELMHAETYLSVHEHVHVGDTIFTYLIHEDLG